MSNFLDRLEIQMEKKIFSFLLIFLIIFLGVDVVSIIIVQLQTTPTLSANIIYVYLIPLIITLIFAGAIVDRARRSWFLLLLIPEGLLTFVLAFNIGNLAVESILWVFIGILSGFTIVGMLAFFADVTKMEQRGKTAGIISGFAWIVAATALSWYSSTIFVPMVLIIAFAIVKLIGAALSVYILFAKTEETIESVPTTPSEGRTILDVIQESYGFVWDNPKFRIYLISFVLIFLAQGIFLPVGGAGQTSAQDYRSMASIGFAAAALFLLIGGPILDKGRKQILFYGSILAVISFLSYFFPVGAVFLAGFAVLIVAIIIVISDIAPPDRRARYYSVFLSLNLLTFFLGYLIGNGAGGSTASPWVAFACAVITGLALLFIYLWGEETNLEEVTFPTSPTSFSIDTSPPEIEEKTPDEDETPLVPPSVED